MSELARRTVHASGSVVPLAGLLGAPWPWVQWFCLFGLGLATVLETLRLSGHADWWIFRQLTREYEAHAIAGYALYVVSFAVTAWLFSPGIAVPSMLMLSIADPVSGLLSRGELGVKRGYVMFVTFAVCLAIASLLAVGLAAGIAGSLAATLADGVKPRIGSWVLDDNLTMPIAAAVAMAVVGVVVA